MIQFILLTIATVAIGIIIAVVHSYQIGKQILNKQSNNYYTERFEYGINEIHFDNDIDYEEDIEIRNRGYNLDDWENRWIDKVLAEEAKEKAISELDELEIIEETKLLNSPK